MKQVNLCLIAALLLSATQTMSQLSVLTVPPNGGNKKAVVGELIGITQVTIHYDRPGVKGREGRIFGTAIVPYGFVDWGFGSSRKAPWRAGANENTTFEFSTDVRIEGKELRAGKYGFFAAMGPDEATIIFSNNSSSFGSFFYDPKEDALQVTVKLVKLDQSVEWLKYEFENQSESSSAVSLIWERTKVPFTIEVDYLKTQLESFRRELRSNPGLRAEAYIQAAQFCIDHNSNLDEALAWAENALTGSVLGRRTFTTLSTKASALERLGKQPEADLIMKEAFPLGDMFELQLYGRQCIARGKKAEALRVFQMNYDQHPNEFITLMGLARGHSANGDFKTALKYARLALTLSGRPGGNRAVVEVMIAKLEEGKDGN